MPILRPTPKSSGYSGYSIDQSMLLDGSSDYLSWTAGTPTDSNVWTFSAWIKRNELGRAQSIITADTGGASDLDYLNIIFQSTDTLQINGWTTVYRVTSRVFRDTAAFGHLMVSVDTGESTANDRIKVYWNGVQITDFSTTANPGIGNDIGLNSAGVHNIGREADTGVYLLDAYLSEVYFIDGTAHDPTDFGEFYNGTTKWRAIEPSGLVYGTNGFHLDFSNGASLGEDQAGSNDWTTNGSPSQTSDGPTKNYATLNPLDKSSIVTLSDGNRGFSIVTSSHLARATFASKTPWYCEAECDADTIIGIVPMGETTSQYAGQSNTSRGYYGSTGDHYQNASVQGTWSSFTSSNRLGFAVDEEAGTCAVYRDNILQGTWTGLGNDLALAVSRSGADGTVYFESESWTYTPPAGFVELSAANLPNVTITDPGEHFNAVGYTGDGTAIGSGGNAITGVGFQSDFTWIKNRDQADSHMLFDVIRGATEVLHSNETAAETTESETLDSFDSDGFTLGSDVEVNTNTEDYISWNWKAGGTGVANTDGSISSTVSVNDDAGFSIVGFTGTGSAGTVGHGQSGTLEMIIGKNRSATSSWPVYHAGIASDAETDDLLLDSTQAATDRALHWNDTAPTSSVFSVGTGSNINASSADIICYCFRSIPGYSKVFSYTGNGSTDGPFVHLGFKPRWLMIKESSSAGGSWQIYDSERQSYNVIGPRLNANSSDSEATSTYLDFGSSFLKIRVADQDINVSGRTYIGIAFAENPFGGSNIPLGLAQ